MAGQASAKFQCAGRLQATLTLNVSVGGINIEQDPVPIDKTFGNGQPGDEYSDPLVMACCSRVTDPLCSSSASQACTLDLIQTSCQSLAERIAQKADEQGLPGPEQALDNLANHVRDHQAECRTAFGLSEVESIEPTCTSGGGSSYGSLLAGRQWAIPGTFSGGTTDISNVVVKVDRASITGVYPEDNPDGCWSLEDNDGEPHFLDLFPSGPLVKSN